MNCDPVFGHEVDQVIDEVFRAGGYELADGCAHPTNADEMRTIIHGIVLKVLTLKNGEGNRI
tara:strand:+ start:364 stop:549 length:186 start_codon:yes stop_codon:yes gene_type:complete